MQNPFRHHDRPEHPDFDRDRDRDEMGWQARDRRPDEYRTWGGGDGGRTAEAYRHQGHEQDRYGSGRSYAQERSTPRQGESYGGSYAGSYGGAAPYGPASERYGRQGPDYSRGQSWRSDPYGGSGAYGPRDDRGDQGYSTHGYAPGSEIWRGGGQDLASNRGSGQHDFEPDYLHWREQQLSSFDKDYTDWRSERRQKFSADFDTWRQNRPRVQADNPIVGDVSDGGTGDASEVKKR